MFSYTFFSYKNTVNSVCWYCITKHMVFHKNMQKNSNPLNVFAVIFKDNSNIIHTIMFAGELPKSQM